MEPHDFGIISENFPVWLLGLDKAYCRKIYVLGIDSAKGWLASLTARGLDPLLLSRAVVHLGMATFVYADPPGSATLLVSGSIPFLMQTMTERSAMRGMYLFDEPSKSRIKLSGPARWSRLRHATFGGSTNFPAILGTVNLDLTPHRTDLIRTLGHILDHGIKPRVVSATFDHSQALTSEDRLDPRALVQDIVYRTSFTHNGWGVRSLTPDELGIAFGLPSWLRLRDLTPAHFPFVPIQILDGCLQALCGKEHNVVHALETPAPRHLPKPATRTWLPSVDRFLPHTWINDSFVTAKATKRDDAAPPTELWDQRIRLICPTPVGVLSFLRQRLMAVMRRKMLTEFRGYMAATHGVNWESLLSADRRRRQLLLDSGGDRKRQQRGEKEDRKGRKRAREGKQPTPIETQRRAELRELVLDAEAGSDVLLKLCDASWWEWTGGSTLIFWRWPQGMQRQSARNGMTAWIQGRLPTSSRPAPRPNKEKFDLILPKLKTILDKGYVRLEIDQCLLALIDEDPKSFVESLTDYFEVPKGSDIRLVYNGTSCGLNVVVWAPNFWLPVPKSASRVLNYNYCSVDIDLGDCFLNFPLPKIFRRYSGIDLKPFKAALGHGATSVEGYKARWERCWMGFRPSPYYSVRFYYWAGEFGRGNP